MLTVGTQAVAPSDLATNAEILTFIPNSLFLCRRHEAGVTLSGNGGVDSEAIDQYGAKVRAAGLS